MYLYINVTRIYHIPATCFGMLYGILTEGYSYFCSIPHSVTILLLSAVTFFIKCTHYFTLHTVTDVLYYSNSKSRPVKDAQTQYKQMFSITRFKVCN